MSFISAVICVSDGIHNTTEVINGSLSNIGNTYVVDDRSKPSVPVTVAGVRPASDTRGAQVRGETDRGTIQSNNKNAPRPDPRNYRDDNVDIKFDGAKINGPVSNYGNNNTSRRQPGEDQAKHQSPQVVISFENARIGGTVHDIGNNNVRN